MRFHCLLFGYRRLADVPLKAIPVNFVVFVLVLGVRYESVSQCGEMVMSRLVNKRVLFHKLWAENPPYNLYFANWTCSFSLFSRANLRFFFEFSKLFLHFFSSSGHFSRKSPHFPLEGWEKRGNLRKTFYNYCYSLASEKANEKPSAQQSKKTVQALMTNWG